MASKKDAYALGRALGQDFIGHNREMLTQEDSDSGENWTPEGIALSVFYEHYSQFSPWEFTANEFNESRDPDGVWAAFEDGLAVGARKAARAIHKEG